MCAARSRPSCGRLSLAIQLLGEPEVLHQRDVRGTNVAAASTFEAVVQAEPGRHFFVAFLAREQAQTRRIQVHGAGFDAGGALDAGVNFAPALEEMATGFGLN